MSANKLPKISLVTVSYNQGGYLEKTIKSVLDENYPNLEYIIIDGGSTDNSVEIIKKYESQLAYWVSEKDSGQSEAIIKGLNRCTGDIFNWLCSDDYLEPGALHKIGQVFADNPDTHIVYGKVREFNNEGTRDEIKIGTRIEPNVYKSIVRTFITQPVTFWRLDVFREVGLNTEMHWFMDYEMWVRYLIKYGQGNVKKIEDLLAHYLFHEKSKSQMESDYTQTRKSSKYKIDMNTIHFELCKAIEYKKFYEVYPTVSTELVSSYKMNLLTKPDVTLFKKIVNYYVFDNAVRYYWAKDYAYSAWLFSFIETEFLDDSDLPTYKDLSYRSRNAKLLSTLRSNKVLRFLKDTLWSK